jgi:predicted enzyme related to lactoylglutathione lyase
MKALGLAWLGIPTERFEPTVAFFRDVLGLEVEILEEDFAKLRMPGGDAVEVFGPSRTGQEQFVAGPIVGFRVEDVRDAREELEAAGVEFIGEVHAGEGGGAWSHFRGPNGKTYEIMQLPDNELPR